MVGKRFIGKAIASMMLVTMVISSMKVTVFAEKEAASEVVSDEASDVIEENITDSTYLNTTVTMTNTEYESKMNSFISDSRWKNGISWGSNQRPKLSSHNALSCFAYCCDFTKYVYGYDKASSGNEFFSVSEIRAGDIVKVRKFKTDINGNFLLDKYGNKIEEAHYFVVLGRNGNSLYTADGNYSSQTRVTNNGFSISGSSILGAGDKTFQCGWHWLNLSGGGSSSSSTASVSDGVYYIGSAMAYEYGLDVDSESYSYSSRTNVQLWNVYSCPYDAFYIKHAGNGYYTIRHVNTDKYLTAEGAGTADETNVVMYRETGGDDQLWSFVLENDKYYRIISKCAGKSLDVSTSKCENGANIQLYSKRDEDYQRWRLGKPDDLRISNCNAKITSIDHINGTYNVYASFHLDSGVVDRVEFPTWTSNNGQDDLIWHRGTFKELGKLGDRNYEANFTIKISDHNWERGEYRTDVYAYDINTKGGYVGSITININQGQNVSDGVYYIGSAMAYEYGLDVDSESYNYSNRTNVQLWNVYSCPYDAFYIKHVGNGYYTIRHVNTNKYLTVEGAKTTDETNVVMYTETGGDDQLWSFEPEGSLCYRIISKCGGKSLDVSTSKCENGANIQIYSTRDEDYQKWRLGKPSDLEFSNGSVKITSIDKTNGTYTVHAIFHLESGVIDRVEFPTWTKKNGQDDLVRPRGTFKELGKLGDRNYEATFTVKISDHNGERGEYITDVYAYDINNKGGYIGTHIVDMDLPISTYTVSVTSSGNGTVTGAGSYKSGETVTLKATPNTGYKFDGWYNESGTRVSTNATYSFTVTQNQTFTAKFVKDESVVPTYVIKTTTPGNGTVTGDGTYTSGEYATIKATANTGYVFDGWYNESGVKVSASATYKFIVTKNQTFTAKFVKETGVVPGPNTPSTDNTSEISLSHSSVNLGWVVDGRRIIYDSVTLVPQIKDYNDLKAKVVWSIEGTKTEVAEAKKYLTLSNGKLTAKKNSAGRTVTVRAQLKGTDKYATVKVNLIGERDMYDTVDTQLDTYKDTFDINIKGKGMGAAKPNPNLGIMLPVRGITSAKANKIKWTTSDKTVATVSGTGKVTGKSAGTATITATLDGKSVQYKVRVHVASVTFKQPKGYVIEAGDQMNLTQEIESLTGIDTDVYDVRWSIPENQLKFGAASSNGMFTAKAKGTVNVTAEINGVTNKMRIKIVP